MRHRKSFNHLGRKSSHRKAMLANMATSLILNKRIKTTEAKAKALRSYVEPLITKSKEDTTHSRRVVFSYLKNKYAVSELFREVSGKVAERPGGYTRILKLGSRLGDNAEMCIIELVDFNELLLAEKSGAKETAGKRSRRGKKKTNATPGAPVEVAEATVKESGKKEMAEEVKNEEPVAKSATDKAEEKQQVTDKVEVAEEKPDKNAVEDTEKKEENSEEDATEKKE